MACFHHAVKRKPTIGIRELRDIGETGPVSITGRFYRLGGTKTLLGFSE
jgi:hypothetical protein